jgi:hypothetical protein
VLEMLVGHGSAKTAFTSTKHGFIDLLRRQDARPRTVK